MTWTSSSVSDQRATVASLVRAGTERLRESGSGTARLDAELLLGHVLRMDRVSVLTAPDLAVGADHAAAYEDRVARRALGEPVAYIRGIKEFYGLALAVDARALIPRPETELLVEIGLDRLRAALTGRAGPLGAAPVLVWDVGTGSGAITVALAVECRRRGYASEIRFRATDASADALALAVENAVVHGMADQIEFAVADLTSTPGELAPADVLLANLPYVPSAVVPTLPVAASFEPVAALDGGQDGLDLIRGLIAQLDDALTAGGVALLEIGADESDGVRAAVAKTLPGWHVAFHDDLAGIPRVAEINRDPHI
ncbi:MAG: peptide chain release factor N(5)-glutamine methyltransferase [Candidatus Limnocylindrales bacterium]